jgi:hypothetical protein
MRYIDLKLRKARFWPKAAEVRCCGKSAAIWGTPATPHGFADKGDAFESDGADCLDVYQARRF